VKVFPFQVNLWKIGMDDVVHALHIDEADLGLARELGSARWSWSSAACANWCRGKLKNGSSAGFPGFGF